MSTAAPHRSAGSAAAGAFAVLLDSIEWPVTMSVLAFGLRIGVRINIPDVAEVLIPHLPPGAECVEFSDVGRVYSLIVEEGRRSSVYLNGALLTRRPTLQQALRAFESDVQLFIAEMAPERVFVHAGVVGHRGCAILLPGHSFSGKSTLVAELVRAGAEYYSDEYAVLDADGQVHPYPRALAIRQAGGVTKHPVHTLGGRAGTGPLPVGLVVVTKFRSGAEWRPSRLSPGHGTLALLANTVPARRLPEIVLTTLRQVVSTAPVVASERGEASGVVEKILELAAFCVDLG